MEKIPLADWFVCVTTPHGRERLHRRTVDVGRLSRYPRHLSGHPEIQE
jgi:hypothetical protein